MLDDILYPNEKDFFCARYRLGLGRVGEALANNGSNPRTKANVLGALKGARFSKEDLREMGWAFSNNLWNVVGGGGGGGHGGGGGGMRGGEDFRAMC